MAPSDNKTEGSSSLPYDIRQQANCTVQVTPYSHRSHSHKYSYAHDQLTVYPLLNVYMPIDTAEGLGTSQKKSD